MKPIYEMAVMNVRLKYPGAQDARMVSGDARFRETLKSLLWEDYCYLASENELPDLEKDFLECWEDFWKPNFIPDLWLIDNETNTIHLFEIEDTHPLTQEKLAKLHNYWWVMDGYGWQITLTVFDRYGLNGRQLDLTEYAFHMLSVLKRDQKEN